jgi:hypothetical protein
VLFCTVHIPVTIASVLISNVNDTVSVHLPKVIRMNGCAYISDASASSCVDISDMSEQLFMYQ